MQGRYIDVRNEPSQTLGTSGFLSPASGLGDRCAPSADLIEAKGYLGRILPINPGRGLQGLMSRV